MSVISPDAADHHRYAHTVLGVPCGCTELISDARVVDNDLVPFLPSSLQSPPPPQRHIKSIDDMSMKVLIDQPLGVTSSGNGWFVIGGTRMQFMIHTFGRTWIKSRIGF